MQCPQMYEGSRRPTPEFLVELASDEHSSDLLRARADGVKPRVAEDPASRVFCKLWKLRVGAAVVQWSRLGTPYVPLM